MHVYGGFAPPTGVIDRVPVARRAPVRAAETAPAWAPPVISTRVELPAPAVWPAPDPALLYSLTIAPLRLAPVSWAPPTLTRSPWSAPVPALDAFAPPHDTFEPGHTDRDRSTPRRGHSFAYALAGLAAAAVGLAVIVIR